MAKQLQVRRGTTQANALFVGAQGEITMDTEKNLLHIHDGTTTGGFMIDVVVVFQAPSAANNYTWCRKYASGWVEQGGNAAQGTVTFPITMRDANYTSFCQPLGSGNNVATHIDNKTTTSMSIGNGQAWTMSWRIEGMAA